MIVVLLLLGNDGTYGCNSAWIVILEHEYLLLQMTEHDAFDSDASRGNGATTEQPGSQAENVAADAAQPVTATAWLVPSPQFRRKDAQVSTFVRTELTEFVDHVWGGKPREEDLAGINVDRPTFTGMINLDDAIT